MPKKPDIILVVEDSEPMQAALVQALENTCEARVLLAGNYADAAKIIKTYGKSLFLAVLDFDLRDAMHGNMFDYAIDCGVPSLILTSSFDDTIRRIMLTQTVVDHVIKDGNSVGKIVQIIQRLQANRKNTILIVDDSSSARISIVDSLRIYGFQILTAEDGKAALEVLNNKSDVELILTDFEMPKMNGVELICEIRRAHNKNKIAIIGISSTSDNYLSTRFIKSGANDFIHKPFTREEMYHRVLNSIETLELIKKIERSKQRVKDLEESHRNLIEYAPIGIFRSTENGQYLFANSRLANMYGFNSSRDLMNTVQDINTQLYVDPADREAIKAALRQGSVDQVEVRRKRRDGSIIWVSLSMRPIHDESGAIIYYEGFSRDITRRKMVEEALIASDRTQRAILESIDAGIVLIAPESHTIVAANPAAVRMFGALEDEIIGRTCHHFLCPADVGSCPITDLEQEVEHSERILLRADGQPIPVLKSVRRVTLGKEELLLETFIDISKRKHAEEQLKFERIRLENIIAGTDAGTWEWNIQTGATVFNERWASMVGYTLAELSPVSIDTWSRLAHPDDLNRSSKVLADHFAGKTDFYESECRMRHKDGHWIWVMDRGRVVTRDQEGKPLMMYGTHIDISEKRQALLVLKESEMKFRAFFESAEAIKLIIDPDSGAIIDANSAAADFYGYKIKDLRKMFIFDINTLSKEKIIDKLRKAVIMNTGHFFFKHKLSDGTVRDVESYTSKVLHLGKTMVMSWLHDITDVRRLEQIKSDVEYIMRHDLKAPLSAFINIPPMLMGDGNLTSAQKEMLSLLGAAGKKMLGQINASLELIKLEQGNYKQKKQECRPVELINEITDILTTSRGLSGDVVLLTDHASGNVRGGFSIRTDVLLLDIILTNLIGNALDASRPGDHVSIDVRTEGNNYVIAISNSLPVPVEIRDRFFEKYATAGKVGGTGIGTYSAAIMTKAIGGRIKMNTSEDTGTTVSVSIPLLSGANE